MMLVMMRGLKVKWRTSPAKSPLDQMLKKTNQRTKIMPAVFNPSWWHIPSFKLRWYKLAEKCMKDGTFAFITQLSTLGPVCFVNRLFFQNVLV